MFTAENRVAIVNALCLSRDMATATGVLTELMTELEEFDTANGPTFVFTVQNCLSQLDALTVAID